MFEHIKQFCEVMAQHGLTPPNQIEPGKLHRFPGAGKDASNTAGWCRLFEDGQAGVFGDWSTDLEEVWHSTSKDKPHTSEQSAALKQQIALARKQNILAREQQYATAQETAARVWREATPCTTHPYLDSKGVQIVEPLGLAKNGTLIVPVYDVAGQLQTLQFITADGQKRFLTGGKKQGGCYPFGELSNTQTTPICVCEGFATGVSIHQATGYPVIVAFDAGNLLAVTQATRQAYPHALMVVCADDDHKASSNTGIIKAQEVTQQVKGCVLAIPPFDEYRTDHMTDFNDLHQVRGLEAVADCINHVLRNQHTMPSPHDLLNANDLEAFKPMRFSAAGGQFDLSARGVFFIGTDKDGNEQPPIWICSLLRVIAKTRNQQNSAWGRLITWQDDDGVSHQWAMPLELLQGDGLEVRRELSRQGLAIASSKNARDLLMVYLQTYPVTYHVRCVERLGWFDHVYVLPQISIAPNVDENIEGVAFQNAHAIEPALAILDSVEAWRNHVAAKAAGNTRLIFALSVAFGASLAALGGEESGGFHLRGASSSGKSTALKMAASVWGHPDHYPRLWRATTNGLEGLAALHNDNLLILDELSQIDPKEIGDAAYMLANGQGKTRASRLGAARQSNHWRLLFLSAGEESLNGLMARVGRKSNAGQEIRLADIEADAGAGMGLFDTIHDYPTPAAFALAIKTAVSSHYGAVGVAWLRHLVINRLKLIPLVLDGIKQFVQENISTSTSGQVARVARRFALVAVAGELATYYGLTGWQENEASRAVEVCFKHWLAAFGDVGSHEEKTILSHVHAFIETHGASRFEELNSLNQQRIPNRAGFYRLNPHSEMEYLVLPETFQRELCLGFDVKKVKHTLIQHGVLITGKNGMPSQNIRLPGLGSPKVYVLRYKGDHV